MPLTNHPAARNPGQRIMLPNSYQQGPWVNVFAPSSPLTLPHPSPLFPNSSKTQRGYFSERPALAVASAHSPTNANNLPPFSNRLPQKQPCRGSPTRAQATILDHATYHKALQAAQQTAHPFYRQNLNSSPSLETAGRRMHSRPLYYFNYTPSIRSSLNYPGSQAVREERRKISGGGGVPVNQCINEIQQNKKREKPVLTQCLAPRCWRES